jgi:hypothetical protein
MKCHLKVKVLRKLQTERYQKVIPLGCLLIGQILSMISWSSDITTEVHCVNVGHDIPFSRAHSILNTLVSHSYVISLLILLWIDIII